MIRTETDEDLARRRSMWGARGSELVDGPW